MLPGRGGIKKTVAIPYMGKEESLTCVNSIPAQILIQPAAADDPLLFLHIIRLSGNNLLEAFRWLLNKKSLFEIPNIDLSGEIKREQTVLSGYKICWKINETVSELGLLASLLVFAVPDTILPLCLKSIKAQKSQNFPLFFVCCFSKSLGLFYASSLRHWALGNRHSTI